MNIFNRKKSRPKHLLDGNRNAIANAKGQEFDEEYRERSATFSSGGRGNAD